MKLMITTVACNIRKQASTDSAILGVLKSNVYVAVEYKVGDWWELPLAWGYIHGDLLRDVVVPPITPTPNPPPPPPPPLGNWYVPMQGKRGVGVSAGGWSPTPAQLSRFTRNNVKTAFICAYEKGQAKTSIRPLQKAGAVNFIFRACWRGGMEFFADESAEILKEYYDEMVNVYGQGNFPFIIQVHNEPNLNIEGYLQPNAWDDGYEFSAFYKKCALLYKKNFNNAKIIFPALSPGVAINNGNILRRSETQFASECATVIKDTSLTDAVGVHYYWQDVQGLDINPPIAFWQRTYYNRPLIATEVAPADAINGNPRSILKAYQVFDQIGVPNIAFVLSGSGGWKNSDWELNNILL